MKGQLLVALDHLPLFAKLASVLALATRHSLSLGTLIVPQGYSVWLLANVNCLTFRKSLSDPGGAWSGCLWLEIKRGTTVREKSFASVRRLTFAAQARG